MQFQDSSIILLPSAPNLHIKSYLHTVKLKGHSAEKKSCSVFHLLTAPRVIKLKEYVKCHSSLSIFVIQSIKSLVFLILQFSVFRIQLFTNHSASQEIAQIKCNIIFQKFRAL